MTADCLQFLETRSLPKARRVRDPHAKYESGVIVTNDGASRLDLTGLSLDEAAIVEIERRMPRAQNVESLTQAWDDKIVYYDFGPGRHENKAAAVAEIGAQFGGVTNIRTQFLSLTVKAVGSLGYAFSRQNFIGDPVGGGQELNFVFRKTDVYEKKDGQWWLVHQHLSFPTDAGKGIVILESEVDSSQLVDEAQ
jgi:ketosteroid isomerase-like protein